MATDEEDEKYQSFKRGESEPIFVQVIYHTDSCQHVVYWVDIIDAFPSNGDIVVMKGKQAVPRAMDKNGERGPNSRQHRQAGSASSRLSFEPTHASHAKANPTYQVQTAAVISTEVIRAERPPSSTLSSQFMLRMELTAQSLEQSIREGQLIQAKVVQQESESIKEQMAHYHTSLKTEVAKNTTLQNQVNESVVALQKMTDRILELQEAQMDNDKRMMAKLALIHNKVSAILTQTYELHEFPIPRLFIILPKEVIPKREKIGTIFIKRFRLYFLCECGEHTRPVEGPPSSLSHEIHLAHHGGYDLDRPNEFFRKYGSYVLVLLQMLKYGVIAAGMVVPPLNAMKVADGLAVAEAGLKALEKFEPRVDSAIDYLQGLTAAQE
ncbi:hypothetical protein BGX24_011165, partial [Mortierella sp. AD032]